MKKSILSVSGKTDEGKMVMAGVGTLVFTKGVPLELVLHDFKSKGHVVDWLDYIQTALNDGHNPRTIQARMEAALGDVMGKAYTEEVMKRTRMLFQQG